VRGCGKGVQDPSTPVPSGSNERIQGSPDAVSPFFETLYYYPDEKTRGKNTDTLLFSFSEDWHPFQRFDKDGIPKRFDILDTFSKFLFRV
jgi:hypothetical protein